MSRHLIVATLAGIVVTVAGGCAATPGPVHYSLIPIRSNGQDLPGLDGKTILESRQPGGIVSARGDEQFSDFGAGLVIVVQNKSPLPAEFGPQNVTATRNGKAVRVLAAEELEERRRNNLRNFVRATSRTDEVDIEQASKQVELEYRFNNFGGCPAGQAGCQVFSDDNGSNYRQDRLSREVQAGNLAAAALTLQQNQALVRRALRTSLVAPEAMAGGAVVIEAPRGGGPVDIAVLFNGQTHRFTFAAMPAG